MLRRCPLFVLLSVFLAAGCSTGKDDVSKERLKAMAGGALKEVVPVSGTVLVDGEPTAGVALYLYPEQGGELIRECQTDEEGKYCWTTHTPCDGLEPGSYRLAFRHLTKREKKPGSGGDAFDGKYANPMKGDFKLTVEADTPIVDMDYELKKE